MVVLGDFSVKIIDAKTMVPLREHVHETTHYVEINEPEQEYLISLVKDKKNNSKVVAKVSVDGNPLGYDWQHIANDDTPAYLGPCVDSQPPSELGEAKRIRSFQFVNKVSNYGEPSESKVGKIEVTWYKVTKVTQKSFNSPYSTWSEASARVSNEQKKYQSQVGPTATVIPTSKQDWTCGQEIAKISIFYRSALGLLRCGVIGPNKAKQNKKNPNLKTKKTNIPTQTPKKKKSTVKKESKKNTTIDLT